MFVESSSSHIGNPQQNLEENRGQSPALSVSAAMALAKRQLESVTVRIIGEVSEVSVKAGYKAAYFTVKDEGAALPCMMWNNRYRDSGVQLAVGQLVELTGRFTLYAAKGRMNFDVFTIALAGEGDLRMKVAAIAKRLEAQGLTSPARKRPLPAFPELIGLVTSPRGAAVHDVLRTLRRRFPIAHVLVAGVPVEGNAAAEGIIQGLHCVVDAGAQLVLIVRGGGSFENLMPFNDETLAREIAACPVPVVTGIGHEVDTTIADMVSDVRASTPTGAAQDASPSRESLDALFASRAASLATGVQRTLERSQAQVERVSTRPMFADPMQLFASEALGIDAASERLSRALPQRLERSALELASISGRLERVGATMTDRFDYQMRTSAARLADLSPVNILARGYSITRNDQGEIARYIDQVPVGSSAEITLSDGTLSCVVASATAFPDAKGV
ncbi:MAG: exodeoxyribonuclease VII large subunit [Eggerthellaceae bacterium]|nr:exodeoxyribonuclease VII large subunit [Eggerthellaceae bacterium]